MAVFRVVALRSLVEIRRHFLDDGLSPSMRQTGLQCFNSWKSSRVISRAKWLKHEKTNGSLSSGYWLQPRVTGGWCHELALLWSAYRLDAWAWFPVLNLILVCCNGSKLKQIFPDDILTSLCYREFLVCRMTYFFSVFPVKTGSRVPSQWQEWLYCEGIGNSYWGQKMVRREDR